MPTIKLLLVAGARPNFMKIAPIIRAAEAHNAANASNADVPQFECYLVHTGQHYDAKMSDIFFEQLGIPKPDVSLDVGSGSHAVQTARIMERFEPVCEKYQPDWVVVVGDVNSTVACALVATKLDIKVAHVEAGLRSYDRTMPEEINRLVTDAISDLLLTPSEDASEILRNEGIPEEKIRLVGNIMIDSLMTNLEEAEKGGTLERLELQKGKFIYVTLHRPSNVDTKESLEIIVHELEEVAKDWLVVFPIHPRTKSRMDEFGLSLAGNANIKLLEPLGYHDSLMLTKYARCLLTDSGGLQEESTHFRTPCLTLRPNTERPVTITEGSSRLTAVERLKSDFQDLLLGADRLGQNPKYWDGKTAERIVEAIGSLMISN